MIQKQNNQMKSFPVLETKTVDVLVIGGGTTGVAAAIASARRGAKTAIVEYHGFLGGNGTNIPAWMGFHNLDGEQVVTGLPLEFIRKMQKIGEATPIYLDPICSSTVGVNPNWVKLLCSQETANAGVEIILHSLAVDVDTIKMKSKTRIKSAYVQNREGLFQINANVVIDCTDTGEIVRKAGVPVIRGRTSDHKVQVSSYTVTIGDVDFDQLLDYFSQNPTEIRPFKLPDVEALLQQMRTAEVFIMGAFRDLIKKAKKDGLDLPRDVMPGIAFPKRREIMHVASRVEDVDPNDNTAYTRAELQGMQQIQQWLIFLRTYVPGCQTCRLISSPSHIGIRETNHMKGKYVLTGEDLMTGKQFDDVIALGGYHLDIHSPDHQDVETQRPPTYQIPFKSLLPRSVDGLLVAGRAVSATHEAYAAIRVIPISMTIGQAAGTAAALAVQKNVAVADVPVAEMQERLSKAGVLL